MKKFLMGIIFLIPILVVFAISATGTIISNTQTVYPTTINIKDSDNKPIESELVIDDSASDTFINIEILPNIAFSKEITYKMDDISGYTGEIKLEQELGSNKYKVIPVKTGVARVIVSSKVEATVSKAFTVRISSRAIDAIEIYDESGAIVNNINLFSPQRLYYDIFPMDALEGSQVRWVSDDENVAKVDSNGFLSPVGAGRTLVHLYAVDKTGKSVSEDLLVDTRNALISKNILYTANLAEADADFVKKNAVIPFNAEVSELSSALNGTRKFVVSHNGYSCEVVVEERNPESVGFSGLGDKIYTNNGPVFLSLFKFDTKLTPVKNVTYVSSDPDIASVVGNELIPQKAGRITLTANYDGLSIAKELMVKERPYSFELNMNTEDMRRGIQRTRVWGTKWLDENGGLKNTYQFGAVLPTVDGMPVFDLLWESDKPECAYINQDALISFTDEAVGKEIKITATVIVDGRKTYIKRDFTFIIAEEPEAVNVYNLSEVAKSLNNQWVTVFQDDVYVEASLNYFNNIYGNGYKLSGEKCDLNSVNEHFSILNYPNVSVNRREKIVIQNLQVVGVADYKDAYLKFTGIYMRYDTGTALEIKFCNIRNCFRGVDVRATPRVLFEGNIGGDNFSASVVINYNPDKAAKAEITFKNNVFKNSEGACVVTSCDYFRGDSFLYPSTPQINIEGFLDMYNWKRADQFGNIISSFGLEGIEELTNLVDTEVLLQAVERVLNAIVADASMKNILYSPPQSKDKYICMGIFNLGIMLHVSPEKININDSDLVLKELNLRKIGGVAGGLLTIVESLLASSGMNAKNECYLVSYDFEDRVPAYAPGEPIPQNDELYDALNGIVTRD